MITSNNLQSKKSAFAHLKRLSNISAMMISIFQILQMKVEKDAVCKFLKRLNKQLLSRYSEMKTQFERNPPSNNQIKKKFMEWKCKYDELVISTLKQCQDIDEKNFDFKEYIVAMTQQLGSDQQFLELLKNVNSSIETLKDFIRVNLVKDPTIYETTG